MLAFQRTFVFVRSESPFVVKNVTISVEHVLRAPLRYGMTEV
jgi:hypothetical protein